MGRITVFTTNDLNSKRALDALKKLCLPYSEINVGYQPEKLHDVQALTGGTSLPQVFFNTRYIGGVEALLKELKKWANSNRYKTPLAKYEAEVGSAVDPCDKKLALSSTRPPPPTPPKAPKSQPLVTLPDGTKTTCSDITEKLKNSLPRSDLKYKGVVYRNAFNGKWIVETFVEHMSITEKEAIAFSSRLMDSQIIQHVSAKDKKKTKSKSTEFKHDDKEVYILQCLMYPNILNSYCVWTAEVNQDCFSTLANLEKRLTLIELNASEDGLLDCNKAIIDHDFPLLEEGFCELCCVSESVIKNFSESERKSFAINVYTLMLRYAFLKVGFPHSEQERSHFLNNVKFNVGKSIFSFQEWMDGVLRANAQAKMFSKAVFGTFDRRKRFALSDLDHRVHLAVNMGPHMGSSCSAPFTHFTPKKLDEQLAIAAKVFCDDHSHVQVEKKQNRVKLLANVFKIYGNDFASDDLGRVEKIYEFLGAHKKSDLGNLMSHGKKGPKIYYQDCRWGRFTRNTRWYHKDVIQGEYKGMKNVMKRFQPARKPTNENARLDTLRNMDILDTLPEERFDRITSMVQDTFKADAVFVSLVDQDRQWFKSTQWDVKTAAQVPETPREISFCGHGILKNPGECFVVEDALKDDRFADNPLVTGPAATRFYAGCPLDIPAEDGSGTVNIGMLCFIDQKPRKPMTAKEQSKLVEYAGLVKKELLRKQEGVKDTMLEMSQSESFSLPEVDEVGSSGASSISGVSWVSSANLHNVSDGDMLIEV